MIFHFYLGNLGRNVYNVFLIILLLGFCVSYEMFFVDLIIILFDVQTGSIGTA